MGLFFTLRPLATDNDRARISRARHEEDDAREGGWGVTLLPIEFGHIDFVIGSDRSDVPLSSIHSHHHRYDHTQTSHEDGLVSAHSRHPIIPGSRPAHRIPWQCLRTSVVKYNMGHQISVIFPVICSLDPRADWIRRRPSFYNRFPLLAFVPRPRFLVLFPTIRLHSSSYRRSLIMFFDPVHHPCPNPLSANLSPTFVL